MQQGIVERYGTECFVPMRKERRRDRHGRFAWVRLCALSSYVFVRADQDLFHRIARDTMPVRPMVRQQEGMYLPVVVPDRDMESFIRVAGSQDEQAQYLDPAKLNFKRGDRVRIVGGSLVGVEGIFMQVGGKHEKRVVIQLEGLVAVATAAIPAALVERI